MEATLNATSFVEIPLLDQVQGVLNRSHVVPPRQVQVATQGNKVRLEGTVGSFYQKQMAQEIVRRVDGVENVENQLQVRWR
jgi:osmotically-inducible protein OsmY